ncbi:hypothetical protein MPL1_09622 [Methylophaga lonarensis MPL]|uniref:Uncharacterized protein n=1 Tax=Methylophaga lonarensis MPL TaxID=1286106 RepID=M7NZF2_9GAMM|nr:tetratricopeptide repeat protein [Methylophaga lonarensis]EMR12601.1 hypothetical protein MPL1_09622 [Methylophaga lonarensis MPL]
MDLIKICLVLFLILSSMSCAIVSSQHQLNYEGNRAYLSGEYQEALRHYEKTLEAANKNKDEQYIAIAMYGLGRTNIKLCRLAEAEQWLKQSITAREKLADNDEAIITQNLSELARLYLAQERYTEANVLYERSLPLLYQRKSDKYDPIELANHLDEYEGSLRNTGRFLEAESVAKKSNELRQNNPRKIARFIPDPVPETCLISSD